MHGLVLEHIRAALGPMAADATFVFGEERRAAAGDKSNPCGANGRRCNWSLPSVTG